jgi:hypothetical protein
MWGVLGLDVVNSAARITTPAATPQQPTAAINGHHTASVTASSTLPIAQDSSTSTDEQSTACAPPLVRSRPSMTTPRVSPGLGESARPSALLPEEVRVQLPHIVTLVDPLEVEDQYGNPYPRGEYSGPARCTCVFFMPLSTYNTLWQAIN